MDDHLPTKMQWAVGRITAFCWKTAVIVRSLTAITALSRHPARTEQEATMKPYITATSIAFSLIFVWAALVQVI
jgi:hypothetical protein